jgi:hypothetical protein
VSDQTLSDQEKSSLERSDIMVESNTAIWNIQLTGDIAGSYMGLFKFRCYLNPLQQIAANREYREMLGTNPSFASEHESFLAYALTQLKYRIISAPPFWASANPSSLGGDIADENIISAVLDAALTSEIKFKSQLKKRKGEALRQSKEALRQSMENELTKTSPNSEE